MVIALAVTTTACQDLCASEHLPRCDIREEACHAQVQAIVECMRGQSVSTLPPIDVLSLSEFEAYLRAGADPMMMRSLEWETSLKLLGLIDPRLDFYEGSIEGSLASVAAFYSPPMREVFVIDRGMPMDSADAVATLAHELVHAAQDEESDIGGRLAAARTHEEVLLLKGVVEGEATLYTYEAAAWDLGYSFEEVDWTGFYRQAVQNLERQLDATTSPYFTVYNLFPYTLGGRWQTAQWRRGGDSRVRAGIANPPESSAWFLIESPGSSRTPAPRAASAPCEPPPPPAGFDAFSRDEMGAPLVYAFLQRWGMTHAEARELALRWQRDDLHVYGAGDRAALAWRIVFRDVQTPRWVATELESAAPDVFRAGYEEGVAVILASNDPSALASWTWDERAPCGPP